jgi:hypothetical protein
MSITPARVYRPFAHTNTFKLKVHSLHRRVLPLNYHPIWRGERDLNSHPTISDLEQLTWCSAMNADTGAIA